MGRQPRGLRAVAALDAQNQPAVIRVASIVDGKPFPTLFWLIDPRLCYHIDVAEAGGLIAQLQHRVDTECRLSERVRRDHLAHIALRWQFLSPAERADIRRKGYAATLLNKGVGGIADFTRIRCLHTWYAAHLVVPNTIGAMIEASW